jgi:phage portal protein BeeE
MPTYQNGETLNNIYYSDCLQSHIEQYELAQDEGLGIGIGQPKDGKTLGVELDLTGLGRMDTATHVKTLAEGVRGGVLTPNEARRELDLKPLPGGDTIYLQHQDYPMEMLFEREDLKALEPSPAPMLALPPGDPQKSADIDTDELELWFEGAIAELEAGREVGVI